MFAINAVEDEQSKTISGERVLSEMPRAIFVWFKNATWEIGNLPIGVYPLTPTAISWDVNKHTKVKARRKGYYIRPNFCGTAHWVQGANLEAAIADNGEVMKKVQLIHKTVSHFQEIYKNNIQGKCVYFYGRHSSTMFALLVVGRHWSSKLDLLEWRPSQEKHIGAFKMMAAIGENICAC